MGRGSYLGEALSLSGILKVVEFIILFIAAILHRHGDNGKYIFFGTSAIQMKAVRTFRVSLLRGQVMLYVPGSGIAQRWHSRSSPSIPGSNLDAPKTYLLDFWA